MKANILGGAHYYESIGPLKARVVLTVNGGEFFWRVEVVTGTGTVKLVHSDGTSKLWPLVKVDQAIDTAREFAKSLLKQEKKAA